jgi:hypothetical protein
MLFNRRHFLKALCSTTAVLAGGTAFLAWKNSSHSLPLKGFKEIPLIIDPEGTHLVYKNGYIVEGDK